MKKFLSLFLLVAMILSMSALSGCGDSVSTTPEGNQNQTEPSNSEEDSNVVKIGNPTYLTGSRGFAGNECADGIRLAIEQKGTLWGKEIEYIPVDAGENAKMPSAAQYLLDVEDVKLFIMGSNAVAGAVQQVVQPAGAFQVEVSNWDPHVLDGGWEHSVQYNQMYTQMIDNSLDVILDYLAPKLGKTRENVKLGAIVLTAWQPMADVIREGMEARGLELAMLEVYPDDINDFTPLISKMKAAELDILLHVANTPDTALFVNQTYSMGYRPPIVVAEGMGYDQPEFKELGEAGAGMLSFSYPSPTMNTEKHPALKTFKEEYKSVIGRDPYTHSLQAYSGATVALEAFERAGSEDPDAIKKAFEELTYERGELPGLWGFKLAQEDGKSAYNEMATDNLLNQWVMKDGELVYECIYPADVATIADDQVPYNFFD